MPLLERIFIYVTYIILNCVSACNRTYYGEVGYSYRLNVKKSSKERPFLCHLSFTASGQEHGDFVEVSYTKLYVYTRLKYNEDFNSFEQKKPRTSYHPHLFVPTFFAPLRYYNAFRVVWRDLDSSGSSKFFFLDLSKKMICLNKKQFEVYVVLSQSIYSKSCLKKVKISKEIFYLHCKLI